MHLSGVHEGTLGIFRRTANRRERGCPMDCACCSMSSLHILDLLISPADFVRY